MQQLPTIDILISAFDKHKIWMCFWSYGRLPHQSKLQ